MISNLDRFTAKHKLKRILKEDEKNIEQKFQESVEDAKIEKIKRFFFEDIFQDVMFLYPVSDFPKEMFILLEKRVYAYAEKLIGKTKTIRLPRQIFHDICTLPCPTWILSISTSTTDNLSSMPTLSQLFMYPLIVPMFFLSYISADI